jgi:protein-histidine pros-kinase
VQLTSIITPDDVIAGAMITLGEESIEFGQRHLARAQESHRSLVERIKVIDKQGIEMRQLLDLLLKEVPVAMVLLNERREIVQANDAAAHLFGTRAAQLRGQHCDSILPCYRQCGNCPALLPKSTIRNQEIETAVAGEQPLTLSRSIATLRNPQGGTMIIEAFIDISERKAAEKAKSTFLAIMSHELRTPLNAILGYGELLLEDPAGTSADEQSEFVHNILGAGHQLLGLINDVLNLSRIDLGQLDIEDRQLSIAELTTTCVAHVTAAWGRKRNIAIINTISDPSLMVHGDALRIRQILINLLSNAVKYNKENGVVTISGKIDDAGRLRISVQDTGDGIAKDKLPLLFKPFERLDQVHGTISGVGIGLHIAKQLVEAMHGAIGVESETGQGSTFWFELPMAQVSNSTARTGT